MFSRIDPKELDQNVFSMIGEQWMLVTAGTVERCNTMTASWGGLGVLWGKPVATVYIRPQRYTLEFVEREDCFTLSFFGEEYRKALALCGSKSGRDVDKVKECGFTVAGRRAARPTLRRPGWCWCVKRRTGRTWTRPTSWTESWTGSGTPSGTITASLLGRLWKY